jgi:hypothetical protein
VRRGRREASIEAWRDSTAARRRSYAAEVRSGGGQAADVEEYVVAAAGSVALVADVDAVVFFVGAVAAPGVAV